MRAEGKVINVGRHVSTAEGRIVGADGKHVCPRDYDLSDFRSSDWQGGVMSNFEIVLCAALLTRYWRLDRWLCFDPELLLCTNFHPLSGLVRMDQFERWVSSKQHQR